MGGSMVLWIHWGYEQIESLELMAPCKSGNSESHQGGSEGIFALWWPWHRRSREPGPGPDRQNPRVAEPMKCAAPSSIRLKGEHWFRKDPQTWAGDTWGEL